MQKTRTPLNTAVTHHVLSENAHSANNAPVVSKAASSASGVRRQPSVATAHWQLSAPVRQVRTVQDLTGVFMTSHQWGRLTSATRRRYERRLRQLLTVFGARPAAALTVIDAEDFYRQAIAATAKSGGRLRPAAAKEAVEVARRLWGFAQSYGICRTNPFRAIRFERKIAAPAIWSVDQLAAFITAADAAKRSEIGTAAALAYGLFLGPHDVLAIRREDFDGTSLSVPCRWPGKVRLRVDSNPDLLARVRTLFGTSPGTSSAGALWSGPQGFRRAFARIRRQAGLPDNLTFRTLRPSGLLALYEAGVMPAWLTMQPQFRWTHTHIVSRLRLRPPPDHRSDRQASRSSRGPG